MNLKKRFLKTLGLNVLLVIYYLLIVHSFNGHRFVLPIFLIPVFFLLLYFKKKVKEIKYSWYLLWLIFVVHLFLPTTNLSSVIIYILFIPITFFIGCSDKLKTVKFIYPFIIVLVGIYGFLNLFYYINNFKAKQKIDSPKIVVMNNEGIQVRLDTIKNKIVVLDFWTTNCGLCFKKFPELEKMYLKYKNNPKVDLYALNIPIRTDTIGYAKKKIEKYSYTFPKLYADSDELPKSLNFNGYPRLIILKNSKIRFNGLSVSTSNKKIFVKNLTNEIELLLNEDI